MRKNFLFFAFILIFILSSCVPIQKGKKIFGPGFEYKNEKYIFKYENSYNTSEEIIMNFQIDILEEEFAFVINNISFEDDRYSEISLKAIKINDSVVESNGIIELIESSSIEVVFDSKNYYIDYVSKNENYLIDCKKNGIKYYSKPFYFYFNNLKLELSTKIDISKFYN